MSTPRPTERAFVVQFDPVEDARVRLRGRVERVASGEATHFRSLKQLVRFMADAVRRQASDGEHADS
jgi:hypothetical protein